MRSAALNLLLALASAALCVGAFELYLKWDNRRPDVEPARLSLGGQQYRFFEKPEALAALDGATAVLGDSFTAGEACADGRSYPARLERLARESGEPRYRAVNLGVPGADPFMYLQVMEGFLAQKRVPAATVVTLYSNDIELTCSACRYLERIRAGAGLSEAERRELEAFCERCGRAGERRAHYGPLRRAHTWLWHNVHAYALFRDAFVRASMRFGWNIGWGRSAYPALWLDEQGLEFKLLGFALAGIRDALAAAGGARPLVVIYPDVTNIGTDNLYYSIYRDVEGRLSRTLGLTVRSGYPAFLGAAARAPAMPYSLVDDHPSCEAHEMFARWVLGELREQTPGGAFVQTGAR